MLEFVRRVIEFLLTTEKIVEAKENIGEHNLKQRKAGGYQVMLK